MSLFLLLCAVVWIPVLLYEIGRRRFAVLLIWLLLAPFTTLLLRPSFMGASFGGSSASQKAEPAGYLGDEASVSARELLDPTRLLFIAYLFLLLDTYIRRRRKWMPLDRTELFMGLFVALVLASVMLSSNRLLFGVRIAMDAFVIPFLGYFIARRLITDETQLAKITRVIIWAGCFVIVSCLVERLTHGELLYRLGGPFRSPSGLLTLLSVMFFVTLTAQQARSTASGSRNVEGMIRLAVLLLTPIVVLLTWSRGSWLGFVGGAAVYMLLLQRLVRSRQRVVPVALTLVFLGIAVFGADVLSDTDTFRARVANLGNIYARVGAWQVVVEEAQDSAFVGIGLNNLRDVLASQTIVVGDVKSEATSHNSYLSLLVEVGVLGLFLYLGVLWSILRTGLKMYRKGEYVLIRFWGITIISAIVAYILPALFANTMYLLNPSHAYLYVVMGGLAGVYGPQRETSSDARKSIRGKYYRRGIPPNYRRGIPPKAIDVNA